MTDHGPVVVFHRGTGRIVSSGISSSRHLLEDAEHGVLRDVQADPASQYVSSGLVVVDIPTKPSEHHTFNWVTHQWVDERTLRELQDAKWEEIKEARDEAMSAPLSTPYGVFQCDQKSRAFIEGCCVQTRELLISGAQPTVDFTLLDNSVVTLTAEQMISVGLLLGLRIQQSFATGRALRTAIYDPSATAETVAAISWP